MAAQQQARLELRLDPALKDDIEAAAAASGSSTSDFVRRVLAESSREILRRQNVTVVSPAVYDMFMAYLDEPAETNERLKRGARQRDEIIK